MRPFVGIFVGLLLLAACGEDVKEEKDKTETNAKDNQRVFPDDPFGAISLSDTSVRKTITGMYTGDFGKGFIHLHITFINEHRVVGYNILKGLQRNLSGKVTEHPDNWELTLSEAGDRPDDGIFTVRISREDYSLQGSWKANNPKIASKTFTLKKMVKEEDKNDTDEIKITRNNFSGFFTPSFYNGYECIFNDNGKVSLTYAPTDDEGNHLVQEEKVLGSWRIISDNGPTIELMWQKNSMLKKQQHRIKVQYDDQNYPFLQLEEIHLTPQYF